MNEAIQMDAELSDSDRLRNAIQNQIDPQEETQDQEPQELNQEATQDEVIADAEGEVEETTTPDETHEANEESLSLEDISSLFGFDSNKFDLDEDGTLLVKTKIDGEEGRVTLQDIVKSYQLEGHLNKQNMEVQEVKKTLNQERESFKKESETKLQNLEDSLILATNQLNYDFQGIDWAALEQTDPNQFLLARQKFADRQNQLNHAYQTLQQERIMQRQVLLEKGKEALFNAIPEWKDAEVREKGKADMKKGLQHYGFNNEEITAVLDNGMDISGLDHRIYLMVRDALSYRKLQDKKPEIEKKVAKAPKVVKGSTKTTPKQTTKSDEIIKSIRKTGGKKGDIARFLKSKQ